MFGYCSVVKLIFLSLLFTFRSVSEEIPLFSSEEKFCYVDICWRFSALQARGFRFVVRSLSSNIIMFVRGFSALQARRYRFVARRCRFAAGRYRFAARDLSCYIHVCWRFRFVSEEIPLYSQEGIYLVFMFVGGFAL